MCVRGLYACSGGRGVCMCVKEEKGGVFQEWVCGCVFWRKNFCVCGVGGEGRARE